MEFINLGMVSYEDALAAQQRRVEAIRAGCGDEAVLIVEHPPVFTLGRSGNPENLLSRRDFQGDEVELIRTNRGGDITFHGPGQLVAYPHLDLRLRGRDVHRYLRQLEAVVLEVAGRFQVRAFRRPGLTGIWTDEGKLASIGVAVRHWVTMHGLALNVSTDLRYFSMIHPCGIAGCEVTSLSRLCAAKIELAEVLPVFQRCFREVFGRGNS